METLDIGEVAEASGLAPSALRFYERQLLIEPVGRNGLRRTYDRSVLDRLALVVLARRSGFTVKEIRSLLEASDDRSLRRRLADKADELDERITSLTEMRDHLRRGVGCRHESLLECPAFRQRLAGVLPESGA